VLREMIGPRLQALKRTVSIERTMIDKDLLNLQLLHQREGSLTARDRSLETKRVGRTAGKVKLHGIW